MKDLDSIFEKWPNWLRWTLFLPIALLTAFLMRLMSVISAGVMGGFLYGLIPEAIFAMAEVLGFLIGIYMVVPTKKHIFVIIFASLIICLYGGLAFVNITNGDIWVGDNLINLVAVITAIVMMCSLGKDNGTFDSN